MKVEFRSSFAKDLRKIKEQNVRQQVREVIQAVESAESLQDVGNLKKLRVGDRYYRIRVGDYRIGFLLEGDTLVFVRFLSRKDIYKYFP